MGPGAGVGMPDVGTACAYCLHSATPRRFNWAHLCYAGVGLIMGFGAGVGFGPSGFPFGVGAGVGVGVGVGWGELKSEAVAASTFPALAMPLMPGH